MSTRDAVKLAQAMLAAAGAPVDQDGILGKITVDAYRHASPDVRDAIQDAVNRWEKLDFSELVEGYERETRLGRSSVPGPGKSARRTMVGSPAVGGDSRMWVRKRATNFLANDVKSQPAHAVGKSKTGFISTADARALARRYNSLAGLPTGTMELMLSHEAKRVSGGYDPAARGGSGNRYVGLYQFHDGGGSWSDGQRWARTFDVRVPAMFPGGYADAEANTAAAAGYAKMNASILEKRGVPVTKETLYAAHQQGAGGFTKSVREGKFAYAGVQSAPSVQTLRSAYQQATA